MSYLTNKKANECCGCKVCEAICPMGAISMKPDSQYFLYPDIDLNRCINCDLCRKVCPSDTYELQSLNKAYYGVNKENDVIYNSSSGGVFTSIYTWAIRNKYVVYGVCFEDKFQVRYSRATTIEECESFRKSKYVIADSNDVYSKVLKDLKCGLCVLFAGAPCACSALKNYLRLKNINTSFLIIIDIVCHGAGNQKMLNDYIKEIEEVETSDVIEFRFKNKDKIDGEYNSRSSLIRFKNGHKYIKTIKNDSYLKAYYSRLIYRESCGTCRYSKKERVSDITMGDGWNLEKIDKNVEPLKGISVILINTQKGMSLFNNIQDSFDSKELNFNFAINANEQLHKPTDFHENRDKFFRYWETQTFNYSVKKATHITIFKKALIITKNIIKKIFS